jgi:uncharacterized protein YjbI with pentapeptide repeats
MNDLNEPNESSELNDMDNPGQFVAAFFMVVKAGDPSSRHRDDKYVRETRMSPAGRHLGFINWQYLGPDVPSFITVLYQNPGSSDFNVQLMAMPIAGYRDYTGALAEQIWEEVDSMRRRTVRHLWGIFPGRTRSGMAFTVDMNGNRIDIALRGRNGERAIGSSNGAGEHQSALWKFNNDERKLDITMTRLGPFDYTLNIPSKEEILSGDEHGDADFLNIRFCDMNLRGTNLPRANFSRASLVNTKFDLGLLPGCNFSWESDSYPMETIMKKVSFTRADLTDARFNKRPLEDCNFDKAILVNTSFKNAYFRNVSFKGADLAKTDFSEVDFNGIVMDGTEKLGRTAATGTIFRKATIPYSMIGKDWQYLDLSETRFTGTIGAGKLQATGVKLVGTQLLGANFAEAVFVNANLSGANLTGADLTGADFTGANLTGTILTDAKLNNAIFTRTTLASAVLNNADLTGARFSDPPLFGRTVDNRTRLQRATVPLSFLGANWSFLDLTRANLLNKEQLPKDLNAAYVILDEVNLNAADLAGANLDHAQLKGTQLPNSNLTGAKLNNGILIGTIFTNAYMWQAEMQNADITNADFSGAELWGSKANLTGATAVNVSFNHAYLANMDFSNIKDKAFQGCNFADACLVNAKFNNTVLGLFNGKPTSLVNSCLQGTRFEGANLTEANLTNAAIATVEGSFEATIKSKTGVQRLSFDPTTIPSTSTSPRTVCPSGESGPCSAQKWAPKTPRPNAWNYKGFQKKIED